MYKLRDAYVEYVRLTEVDFSSLTLQEMFDHKFELNKQCEFTLRLIDEMEARQSK